MNARSVFVAFLLLLAVIGFYLAFTVNGPVTPGGAQSGGTAQAGGTGQGGGAKVTVPPLEPLSEDEAAENGGLALTIESLAMPGVVDRRRARIPNLFVPDGTSPSSLLPAGPFKATWEGDVKTDIKDDYIFAAEGNGTIKILVKIPNATDFAEAYSASGDNFAKTDGKKIKLGKGKNHLLISYESPAKGDAMVRLNWRSAEFDEQGGFAQESLSPNRLSFDNSNATFRESLRVRKGRELYATLRCESCHGGEHLGANLAAGGMPELTMDAPNLSEAGRRLNTPWIAQWLKNPRALRNESTMPQLLRGESAEKDAEDIAGFLSTLGKVDEKPEEAPSPETIAKGGYTFTNLGCIGCHMLPTMQKAEPGRVMLAYVRDKWKPAALAAFLHKPDAHYAWIRMPDFRLDEEELKNVAAFIRHVPIDDDAKGTPIAPLKGTPDVAHGKELVETMGCLNCHNAGPGVTNKAKGKPFKDVAGENWARGCLSEKEEALGKAPNFHLSAAQRGALLAFVATDRASLAHEALPDFAERQIKSMRCAVCHNRDGKQALWAPEENDLDAEQAKFKEPEKGGADGEPGAGEGKVRQHVPSITWIGEKLKPEWAAQFIDGKMDFKPRIWLKARMPGFHSRAKLIAQGLAIEHGYPTINPPEFKVNPELAEIGAKIAATDGGFGCAGCHKIGGENTRTAKAFEWPAINFKYVKERLMEPFYYKWMSNPVRMEPGTGMVTFAPGNKDQKEEFFGGDGHKQFEALWNYLQAGRDIKSPNPDDE